MNVSKAEVENFNFQYALWLLNELPIASIRGPEGQVIKYLKISNNKKARINSVLHRELRTAVNPLRPGPLQIC